MNKQIENIIKSINRQRRGLRDPQIMHPEREWLIGMVLALSIFVLTATWSMTVYLKNRNASTQIEAEQQSESVVYRETMVAEALARLEKRTAELNTLLEQGGSGVVEVREEEVVAPSTTESGASSTVAIPEEVGTSTVSE
jgi:hypothetical protein